MYKLIIALLLLGGVGYSAYTYLNNVQPFEITEEKYQENKTSPIDRAKVMQYARSFADETRTINSVNELADRIEEKAKSDYEKAAYAYSWIAKNIRYDDAGFNSGKYGDMSAASVIKRRASICNGFCNLFNEVASKMGIQSEKVVGYPKGYGYQPGTRIAKADHAWNVVKINNQWKLLDATWGSGYGKNVSGKLRTTKKFDPFWFDPDPYEFAFKHLPENKKYQFLPKTLTKTQFEKLPKVKPEIFELGFSAQEIFEKSLRDPHLEVPKGWAMDYDIKVVDVPVQRKLLRSQTYHFKIQCQENAQIVFSNGGNLKKLEKVNGFYEGSIQPVRGDLTIMSRLYPEEKDFVSILEYMVN